MSGDRGPDECVAGAMLALESAPDLEVILVGRPDIIEAQLAAYPQEQRRAPRLAVAAAPDVVEPHDSARDAIRRRKHSSMRIAVDLVREGRASGAVSAGNTGALTALSHFVLKCRPEVERAPIMSAVPSATGFTHLLDLGANTRATPLQLTQFAVMGAIVARDVHGLESPRVGLLNIGTEESKGHELIQQAHALIRATSLQNAEMRYVGFVEGTDIFTGEVDVIVTDGFTGNVALKAMEGLAELVSRKLREEFTRDLPSRVAGLVAQPVLRRVAAALDPRRYNGAMMVGLTGVVVKSHGRADRVAFSQAILLAMQAARRGLVAHVSQSLAGGRV